MAVGYATQKRQLGPFARAIACVGPLVESVAHGTFTVIVCRACGDVRWYARGLELAAAPTATEINEPAFESATLGPCVDCGDARASRVARMKTRGSGGQPSDLPVLHIASRRWGFATKRVAGHFSLFVCRGCARCTWIAGGLEAIPALASRTKETSPCRRCATLTHLPVEPVDEDGATLRVVYDKQHAREIRVGRYSLDICTGCGLTDWSAHDTDTLEPDASLGVAWLEAGEGQEGPYR